MRFTGGGRKSGLNWLGLGLFSSAVAVSPR
jgi:hypothetical protein